MSALPDKSPDPETIVRERPSVAAFQLPSAEVRIPELANSVAADRSKVLRVVPKSRMLCTAALCVFNCAAESVFA